MAGEDRWPNLAASASSASSICDRERRLATALDIAAVQQQLGVRKRGRDKDGMDLRETHRADGVEGERGQVSEVDQRRSERGPTRAV